jgi:ribosome maturation factor RimP
MSAVDAVRRLADESASASGLVLEAVTVQAAGRRRVVRVVVDLPDEATGGVPMDAVASVSQLLSQRLDASDAMGGAAYVLEVTSPGVDRPLTERRHWARARGRLVTAQLRSGGSRTGRLEEVGDSGVVLAGEPLAWEDLARGRVEVEFSRPAGSEAPADAADDEAAEDDLDDLDDDETDETDDAEGGRS